MSVVLTFDHFRQKRFAPPLVFVDMFQSPFGEGSAFPGEDAEVVVENCQRLLKCARSIAWPLAFAINVQRLRNAPHSNVDWSDGFRPGRTDMVFETKSDSCYSNPEFSEAMTRAGNCFLLAGFSGSRTCLATLVEASAHGHHGGLIEDACHIPPLNGLDAADSRRAFVAVASSYATTLTTAEWLDISGKSRSKMESVHDGR